MCHQSAANFSLCSWNAACLGAFVLHCMHRAHCKGAEGSIHACAQGMALVVAGVDGAV